MNLLGRGLADPLEDRVEGRLTIDQKLDVVAAEERQLRDIGEHREFGRRRLVEDFGLGGAHPAQHAAGMGWIAA